MRDLAVTMRRSLSRVVVLLAIIGLPAYLSAADHGGSLALHLDLPKHSYVMCENVWLHVYVVNLSNEYQSVPTPDMSALSALDRYLQLQVLRNDSLSMPKQIHISSSRRSDQSPKGIVIPPGDTLVYGINLTDIFGIGEPYASLPIHLPDGEYLVVCSLQDETESKEVAFSVCKPGELDERIAMEYFSIMKHSKTSDQALRSYADLLQRHPDHELAPRICSKIIGRALRDNASEYVDEYCEIMIERYYSSGDIQRALPQFIRNWAEKYSRKEFSSVFALDINRLLLRQEARRLNMLEVYEEVMAQ